MDDFEKWKDEIRKQVQKWDLFERMVEATSFEEYLAGDLPKPPTLPRDTVTTALWSSH